MIGISQSGETADTLAAMRTARERGRDACWRSRTSWASQATRDADGVLYTRAGLEIGVAATKTFVSPGRRDVPARAAARRVARHARAATQLTADDRRGQAAAAPDRGDARARHASGLADGRASGCHRAEFFLYLGRHVGLPVALEGALKLKEISYIATDAYAAGEMKHGPIALLDESTPVVVVATESPVLEKVISNIQEVRARGARVIAIATEGDDADRPARRRGDPRPARPTGCWRRCWP